MDSLNIDLRDRSLRILVIRDGSVRYSKLISGFTIDDGKSAREKLALEIKESGWKKNSANVILPSDIINHKVYQIPSMDIQDAKKVVRRELSKDLKGQKFSLGIRRMLKEKIKAGGQDIFAEHLLSEEIKIYIDLLKSCGLKPDIITSSLEGNIHLFNRFRPETDGNEAVIDIGMNSIEIAVFNNRRFIEYEKIPISQASDEKTATKDLPPEQTDKMKIYKIVDALYNFIMASGKISPEERVSMIWICGLGSIAEGIADSISDGLGIKTFLINPFDKAIDNGNAFSALAGISTVSRPELLINLIPEEILAERTKLLRQTILVASLSFYIIMLIGGFVILNLTEKDLRTMNEKAKTEQLLLSSKYKTVDIYSPWKKTYAKLVYRSTELYTVFRDIANLTPPGVILQNIEAEKAQDLTNLKINANIKYFDENLKNALLSRFLTSLDTSSRLKRVTAPEIATSKTADGQKSVSVTIKYEVMR